MFDDTIHLFIFHYGNYPLLKGLFCGKISVSYCIQSNMVSPYVKVIASIEMCL